MNGAELWILFLMYRPTVKEFWIHSEPKHPGAAKEEAGLNILIGRFSFINYLPGNIYLPPLRPAPPGFPTPFGIPDPEGLTIDGGRAPLALVISGRPLLIRLAV